MSSQVLVLFASQYGFTENYARWIAEDLRSLRPEVEVQRSPIAQATAAQVQAADTVVAGASDYGGFLTGAGELKKLAPQLKSKPRFFFSVSFSGLAGAPAEKLDGIVSKNFGNDLVEGARLYHFRGGLDHTRLSLKHKTTMMGIRAAIAALPNKNEANRQMLESFEKKTVDYSDRAATAPLVADVLAVLGS